MSSGHIYRKAIMTTATIKTMKTKLPLLPGQFPPAQGVKAGELPAPAATVPVTPWPPPNEREPPIEKPPASGVDEFSMISLLKNQGVKTRVMTPCTQAPLSRVPLATSR